MKIGSMTNPYKDLLPQIKWIGDNGFDYVDLAVEPPQAHYANIDPLQIKHAVEQNKLEAIVHTSPYLPVASRHPETRKSAWKELLKTLDLAKDIDSPLMTLHYLGAPPYDSVRQVVDTYGELLNQLAQHAEGSGTKVALENSPINQGEVLLLREIFQKAPGARFLLDIGHIHLKGAKDMVDEFLNDPVLGHRLSHIHLSDNNGRGDLHLPLGSVRNGIAWEKTIAKIRNHPYNGRITLEVFSPDPDYLLISRDKLRYWWHEEEASSEV
jgi:sugar phosphate isomerase/epimerase